MSAKPNFTRSSAEMLRRAQLEAQQRHSRSIEAEHLFLALCEFEDGIVAAVLHEDLHLSAEQAKAVVDQVTAKYAATDDAAEPMLATSLHNVMLWAAQEAEYAQHPYIATEHLLLGLAAATDRPMREIFQQLHLRPEEIRAKIHARVPEIPLQVNRRARLKERVRMEFYHNFTFYVPLPIRKLFGRFLDSSQTPPLG